MKTDPNGHVWLVQVSGTDADIWDTEKNAYSAASSSVEEMFDYGNDEDQFHEDTGLDYQKATDEQIVKWWNANREPYILIECKPILTKKKASK